MLAPMFNFPVLMFLAALPLMWACAAMLRAWPERTRAATVLPLLSTAALVLAAALVGQLVFASMYLGTPTFTDHIEPNTAVVAWLYAQGGQLYHAIDAPERYSFLYGPVPYIASAGLTSNSATAPCALYNATCTSPYFSSTSVCRRRM